MHLLEYIDTNGIAQKTSKGWVIRTGVKRHPFAIAPYSFTFLHEDHDTPLSNIGQLFDNIVEYGSNFELVPYTPKPGRGKKAERIYRYLESQNSKPLTATEIAEGMGIKRYGVTDHLESLHEDHHIRRKVKMINGARVGLYYI